MAPARTKLEKICEVSVLACLGILAIAAFLSAWFPVVSVDLGYHLKYGEWMLEHGRVLKENVFSYTNYGYRFVNDKWLFQVVAFLIYSWAGSTGLIIARIVLVLAVLGFMWLGCGAARRSVFAPAALFLGLLAMDERFMFRPDLVSLALIAAFFFVLSEKKTSRRALWFLVPLQLVWANTHGYFILGPMLTAIFLASEGFLALLRRRKQQVPLRTLSAVFLAQIASCFVNPEFYRGAVHPFFMLRALSSANLLSLGIAELAASLDFELVPTHTIFAYKLLLVAAAVTLPLTIARRRIDHFLCLAVFALMSFTVRRNIGPFAVTAAPIIALHASAASGWIARRLPSYARVAAVGAAGGLAFLILVHAGDVASNKIYVRERRELRFGLGWSRIAYPAGAVSFISEHGLKDRVFFDWTSGGYFLFSARPPRPVFITGDTYAHDPRFLQSYIDLARGTTRPQEVADRYDINVFALRHASPESAAMIQGLLPDRRWRLVFFDHNSAVFIRDIPEHASVITRFTVDTKKLTSADLIARAREADPASPSTVWSTARFLDLIGVTDLAIEMHEEALNQNAAYFEACTSLGAIWLIRGDMDKAREYLDRALEIRPNYFPALFCLGRWHEMQGDFVKAAAYYRRVEEITGSSVHQGLAHRLADSPRNP